MPRASTRLQNLPPLVQQKLTKTGTTRGATVREIYQNRVARSSTVLIAHELWDDCREPDDGTGAYENGFIVLVEPRWYFQNQIGADRRLALDGLELGVNAILVYRSRRDWNDRPHIGTLQNGRIFEPATSRLQPLGGVYMARVHATTSDDGVQVAEGFNEKKLRGAGIRVYEYASSTTVDQTKLQLECLMWLCYDSVPEMVRGGMTEGAARERMEYQMSSADLLGLLDYERLRTLRLLNDANQTICPLCYQPMSAGDFYKRSAQAEGRETADNSTTEVSLFHIEELRIGKLQHRPYNLGWGHHFCNVVVKDAGIMPTLQWMQYVLGNQPVGQSLEEEAASVEEALGG